jgi:hypothetical protein
MVDDASAGEQPLLGGAPGRPPDSTSGESTVSAPP